MGTWIESHTDLRYHPKLVKLCGELKINRLEATGLLHWLWWWAIEYRESGDLIGLFDKDISQACGWEGNPTKLVKSLKKCGWITSDCRIHDWMHYVGRLVRDRERKRAIRLLGQVHGQSSDKSTDSPGKFRATVPYRTVPYRKDLKTGILSQKEEQIILNDIAKTNGVAQNSEFAQVRLNEIVTEISKIKDVKKPLAMARHKALNQ